jgi:hypothetical protein
VRRAGIAICLAFLGTLLLAGSANAAAGLRAGAGKADLTPRTGYYLGGWTRADRVAQGQHTRLYSRAIVLQRGGKKVALVSIDLFMVPGGMLKQIGDRLTSRGFSEQNILISASHTHSGPGGYANFPTLNTAAPSLQTVTDPLSFVRFLQPSAADPQLYRFVLEQIEKSIVRADDDRAPAAAGWGSDRIVGLTRNRSVEAHLNNHGIVKARGDGSAAEDPEGPVHTIDPEVDVLRVDKLVRRGRKTTSVPIGAFSTFANHGTVTKSSFQFYNADHHGSALRVFEQGVRKAAKVPAKQEVVNVYGNSNEGDQSAGLDHSGPAGSDEVGRVEAQAMLRAWKRAGRAASRTPELELRWTRICFCGQQVDGGGKVAEQSEVGLPFLTGSEEERGPLFDITGQEFEDVRSPVDRGDPHGFKAGVPGAGDVPNHVPLLAVRIGPRLIVTLPGEGTKEVGARIRTAVANAVAGSGIDRVVISGLANEFILYLTTPEEYDRQHYEGGNTHFGRWSAVLIQQELARLSGTLARGEPAPAPADFDPTNSVTPDGPAYDSGAASGTIVDQPTRLYERLSRATLAWQGGAQGLDRPVDKAFVTAERRDGRRWVRVDDDLGLAMLWKVNAAGRYDVQWEIPREAPVGEYRFRVTAKRYTLTSDTFQVDPAATLTIERVDAGAGKFAVRLAYPPAVENQDLTYRPKYANGGAVIFRIGNRDVRVRSNNGTFSVDAPAGARVRIEAAGARDRFGNSARAAINR